MRSGKARTMATEWGMSRNRFQHQDRNEAMSIFRLCLMASIISLHVHRH